MKEAAAESKKKSKKRPLAPATPERTGETTQKKKRRTSKQIEIDTTNQEARREAYEDAHAAATLELSASIKKGDSKKYKSKPESTP
eukprot:1102096-Prymnesium_polylepis.1